VLAVTVEAKVEARRRLRRSPLAHRADELGAQAGAVALVELPFLSMVSLRVAPGSLAADRVERALELALPTSGRVSTTAAGDPDRPALSVLWLGPDEWLVVGSESDPADVRDAADLAAPADPAALVQLLTAAVGDGPGSVVDVSANRGTLVISGPNARDLLEKGCTLDLHPRAFGAGRCAQTTFARGHVLLWQTADDAAPGTPSTAGAPSTPDTQTPAVSGPAYRFMFRGSFANYFADWLLDAAAEFKTVRMFG
jgi:sarcosine oxidase, subunit gamma